MLLKGAPGYNYANQFVIFFITDSIARLNFPGYSMIKQQINPML